MVKRLERGLQQKIGKFGFEGIEFMPMDKAGDTDIPRQVRGGNAGDTVHISPDKRNGGTLGYPPDKRGGGVYPQTIVSIA